MSASIHSPEHEAATLARPEAERRADAISDLAGAMLSTWLDCGLTSTDELAADIGYELRLTLTDADILAAYERFWCELRAIQED